jgi:hypothetical protein
MMMMMMVVLHIVLLLALGTALLCYRTFTWLSFGHQIEQVSNNLLVNDNLFLLKNLRAGLEFSSAAGSIHLGWTA